MKKLLTSSLYIVLLGLMVHDLSAQSYAFGLKLGPSAGYQLWDGRPRSNSLLFRYHAAAFIETHDDVSDAYSLFLQAGYHVRGSAVRFIGGVDQDGIFIPAMTSALQFENLSVVVGAKQKFDLDADKKWFYTLGLRGDYTVNYALDLYTGYESGIRPFNYGINVGGGIEWAIQELVGLTAEFTISPDFSRQIYVPPSRIPDPYTGRILPEQNIRNATIELSFGVRFLRKIEYIEDYW